MILEILVKKHLSQYGYRLDLKLGQHFLIDEDTIKTICQSVSLNSTVIEIGAGIGQITEKLCQKAKKVIAVEIDDQFWSSLNRLKQKYSNLTLIFDNFLSLNLAETTNSKVESLELVGNLPFHLVEPLFMKIFPLRLKRATFLVGNDFLKEIQTTIKDSGFGKLTLLINTFYLWKILGQVDKESFYPMPSTNCVIIQFISRPKADFTKNKILFILKDLFLSGRRGSKIKNVLKEGFIFFERINGNSLTQNQARKIISDLKIPKTVLENQFEQLNNSQIKTLYRKLQPVLVN